ncbi:MAG: hypothetical protein U9M92_02410 [Patescibacteria group bacterium]|nr:hypothetical protein [Patescibacteria group bacterium]
MSKFLLGLFLFIVGLGLLAALYRTSSGSATLAFALLAGGAVYVFLLRG